MWPLGVTKKPVPELSVILVGGLGINAVWLGAEGLGVASDSGCAGAAGAETRGATLLDGDLAESLCIVSAADLEIRMSRPTQLADEFSYTKLKKGS